MNEQTPPTIYVDADGCPVKDEIYKVAKRYDCPVVLVANKWMRVPDRDWIRLEVVGDLFDAVDDWIVEQTTATDIVVTGDIPLAGRCLEKGSKALGHRGRVFTEDDIGEALGVREVLEHIRGMGGTTRGPRPFEKRDRSRFLQKLDDLINAVLRGK